MTCVAGYARKGLKRAIREVFPGAVPSVLKAVLAERDPELARGLYRLATAQIETSAPRRPRRRKRPRPTPRPI